MAPHEIAHRVVPRSSKPMRSQPRRNPVARALTLPPERRSAAASRAWVVLAVVVLAGATAIAAPKYVLPSLGLGGDAKPAANVNAAERSEDTKPADAPAKAAVPSADTMPAADDPVETRAADDTRLAEASVRDDADDVAAVADDDEPGPSSDESAAAATKVATADLIPVPAEEAKPARRAKRRSQSRRSKRRSRKAATAKPKSQPKRRSRAPSSSKKSGSNWSSSSALLPSKH